MVDIPVITVDGMLKREIETKKKGQHLEMYNGTFYHKSTQKEMWMIGNYNFMIEGYIENLKNACENKSLENV